MFRLSPSRIALEDIAPADFSNRINPSEAIAASQALNRALESPVLATQAAAVQQPVSNSSAVTPVLLPAIDLGPTTNKMTTIPSPYHAPTNSQLPYDHLPYGPEREVTVAQNLHPSHLDHPNTLSTGELYSIRLQNKIYHWRQGLDEGSNTDELDQAADLPGELSDLRAEPISALAGVKPAESASEPGVAAKTELAVPVPPAGLRDASGKIFGGWAVTGPFTPLCGAGEDVAAVLNAEAEVEAGAAASGSGTAGNRFRQRESEREIERRLGLFLMCVGRPRREWMMNFEAERVGEWDGAHARGVPKVVMGQATISSVGASPRRILLI